MNKYMECVGCEGVGCEVLSVMRHGVFTFHLIIFIFDFLLREQRN